MRFDRFLTLFVFGPFASLTGHRARLPILMYHSIANDVDEAVTPYYRTVTSPEVFEQQMKYLRVSGYRVVTLSRAAQELRGREGVQGQIGVPPAVVVTFDDGFRDFGTTAFPIMKAFGFDATVFLSTAHIGGKFITGRQCLSAAEIRDLAAEGVEFGSHTVTHSKLVTLPVDNIRQELSDSKRTIEGIVGTTVTAFSYPFGFPEHDTQFVETLERLLYEVGYSAGVTTSIGVASAKDRPMFMRRLPVNECDDLRLFRAKLEGQYDWLHRFQVAHKRIRALAQA